MQGYEIFVVVGVIVLLFGGSQLPKLARSLGEAKKEFEKGGRGEPDEPKTTAKVKAEGAKIKADEAKIKAEEAKAAADDDEV
jgi:sec-independent protein translocase protein TatA